MLANLWKDSKRNNVQQLIDLLLRIRADNGWPVTMESRIAFAELASSANPKLTESIIMRVLAKMNEQGATTISDFERIYSQIQNDEAKTYTQQVTWKFFIPLKLNLNADLPQQIEITLLGKKFAFLRKDDAEHLLGEKISSILRNSALLKVYVQTREKQSPQVFLYIENQSPNWEVAWRDIAPAFDALRGLVELTFGFGGWLLTSNRGKSPRRKIPHPLWMLVQKTFEEVEWINFVTDEVETDKVFDVTSSDLDAIKKNAQFLSIEPEPNSSLAIISDCLRLYAQAMDAGFRHECFLGLWQLAEAITRSESTGGDTRTVNSRIAWHGKKLGLKGSGYRETLRVLGEKRNDIVHRGIHDIDDEDINILKFVCETALNWLFQVHKELPTALHIEQFYRLRDISSNELVAIQDCIEYLKNQRLR